MVKLFCSIYWQNLQITAAVHYFQKRPPQVLCKKMCSLKVRKYHRKIPVLESVFNKVAGVTACNFITKKVKHRCFPVKFTKFLRIPILNNISKRLLLYLHYNSHIIFTFITFTIIRSSRLWPGRKLGNLGNHGNHGKSSETK